MNRYVAIAAAGALAMYFLDPELGPRRRKDARKTADDVLRRLTKARRTVEKLAARQP